MDGAGNAALLETMLAKLGREIAAGIGVDDGREMPDFPNIAWVPDGAEL